MPGGNNRATDWQQMEAADPSSLRSMEEDGIITRTVYPEVPPRVEYALSDLGESMRPIIKSMEEFGLSYKSISEN